MELKSLILGLAFSLGAFAVKSGAGLAYLLQREESGRRKLLAALLFGLGYGTVFALCWYLVCRVGVFAHVGLVMRLSQSGMTIHLLLAGLLLAWGTALLKTRHEDKAPEKSRAWLLLSLPCPVCFTVILFTGGFLHGLLPETKLLFAWLYTGFMTAALAASGLFYFLGRKQPEATLGRLIILAGLYFILTISIVPRFADIERIYRLSQTSVTTLEGSGLAGLAAVSGCLFIIGFMSRRWLTERREKPWK